MAGFSQSERRGLERMQSVNPGTHPDSDLLTAFSEQALTTRERDQVLGHLAVCSVCREVLALAGLPVVEPVPEPARKRGLWEMPLFHWGAVAATTIVVVAAVMLSVRQPGVQKLAPTTTAIQNEQPPAAVVPNEDKVVAEPRAKTGSLTSNEVSTVSPAAPPAENVPALAEPRRSLHLQQQARYERPSYAPLEKQNGSGKNTNELVAGNITSSAPVAVDKTRDGVNPSLDSALKAKAAGATQTVTVAAAPPQAAAETVTVGGASEVVTVEAAPEAKIEAKKDEDAAAFKPAPTARAVNGREQSSLADLSADRKAALFKWKVGSDGKLQRSIGTREWQTVFPGQSFRCVAAIQNQIWAGGDHGLYHSADAGQSWTPVSVRSGTIALTGNIINVQFADAQNGSVQTSTGETWVTSNGGQSWQKE